MSRRRTLLLAALVPVLCGCGAAARRAGGAAEGNVVRAADPRSAPAAPAGDAAALRDGNDRFAGRLLALLGRSHPTMALSPYSISQALSMAFAGARGETATQMAGALDFSLPASRLAAAFNSLDQSVASVNGPDVELRSANALYGQRGERFQPEFLALLARAYGAGMRVVDFARDTAAATDTINQWVSAQTAGHIDQLVGPGDLDPTTRMVIVNAVYLHAKWLAPFNRRDTYDAPFHAPAGTVDVATMHRTGTYDYLRGPDYQALELPYQGDRLAFDILLPDPGRLSALLDRLDRGGALELLRGLAPKRAAIAVPKLKLTTRFELAAPLRALGVRLAFEPGADFSGIGGAPGDLSIGAVVHQAYVNVDEEGTEAAAATATVMRSLAILAEPALHFIVDRPFVFVLRDRQTGAILFEGVVSRP